MMSGKSRPRDSRATASHSVAAPPRAAKPELAHQPWIHRLAWLLCVMVAGLLWVGGTVTTYDAGMAVADWPTTYGHWFYPLGRWLQGAWDLFLEHGHRLLAQAVGLLAVMLAALIFHQEQRRAVRALGAGVLIGVLLQGILGGLRVWFDHRLLAQIHGCFAPLVLCLCGGLVAVSSRRWLLLEPAHDARQVHRIWRLSQAVVVLCYVEIILGAQLRHPGIEGWPRWFELLVWLKLLCAGVIALGAICLAVMAWRGADRRVLGSRGLILAGAVGLQIVLAGATWVTNYGWPAWFRAWFFTPAYTVLREGRWQVNLTTAHATLGALCLLAGVSLALWSRHLLRGPVR